MVILLVIQLVLKKENNDLTILKRVSLDATYCIDG
jgi:hypothetical protein